jgi:hypothetical protein
MGVFASIELTPHSNAGMIQVHLEYNVPAAQSARAQPLAEPLGHVVRLQTMPPLAPICIITLIDILIDDLERLAEDPNDIVDALAQLRTERVADRTAKQHRPVNRACGEFSPSACRQA